MLFGRTPVDEVLAFLDEELAWARERGLAAVEADALLGGPYLFARLGRFDEARDCLERSKAICRELGIAYGLAEAHMAGAGMEMLAGDAEAAERELRDAIRHRDGHGRVAVRGPLPRPDRPRAARTGTGRGRLAELEQARRHRERRHGRPPARACSRVAARARRRSRSRAKPSPRWRTSGDITTQAETLVDFAEVLQAHGDPAGAAAGARRGVALHEEKGNLVPAERCRTLLAAIAADEVTAARP